jgi:hypothetical protein
MFPSCLPSHLGRKPLLIIFHWWRTHPSCNRLTEVTVKATLLNYVCTMNGWARKHSNQKPFHKSRYLVKCPKTGQGNKKRSKSWLERPPILSCLSHAVSERLLPLVWMSQKGISCIRRTQEHSSNQITAKSVMQESYKQSLSSVSATGWMPKSRPDLLNRLLNWPAETTVVHFAVFLRAPI